MNGVVAQYWSIIPRGVYQVLLEPITGVDNFDVFGIEECSSAQQLQPLILHDPVK